VIVPSAGEQIRILIVIGLETRLHLLKGLKAHWGVMMKLPRRNFLHLAAVAVTLPAVSRDASALDYPARPVHLLVGFAPGGATDISARLMGQWLSERFGQQFVVENRPGAGSNIATEAVVRAPADGYTLLLAGLPAVFNATLYNNLQFNFLRDIAAVGGIMRAPNVLVLNQQVPVRTVPEFIAYAKAHPGQISMATGGNGSTQHIFGELFNTMAGIKLVPVAYRGGAPAILDLLAGQVQVEFAPMSEAISSIKAGKLRALAVTSAARSAALPDLPTVADFLPGYDGTSFFGITAPRDTLGEIVGKLNRAMTEGLADPKIKERLADLGCDPMPMSAADLSKLFASETEKWAEFIKDAGIRPE
jgi:tripartite-type tricarboxylate transporter receptor subunit TctC